MLAAVGKNTGFESSQSASNSKKERDERLRITMLKQVCSPSTKAFTVQANQKNANVSYNYISTNLPTVLTYDT